jgi:hypothetical protein
VGYGLPSGYVSQSTAEQIATPHLAGVQCENCHGPAGYHAANPQDLSVKPRVELAAEMCGGCHMETPNSHFPTFNEWKTTGHAEVVEDMNPSNRIDSCGRCHSGSARLALLKKKPLPTGDANVPITCVVCHNPHQNTANDDQLRNPLSSMEDYFITTSGSLIDQYNPNINLCAQCHNHRGASWTSSSRPPHQSPQYNVLLGTVGILENGLPPNQPATHARLQDQCVSCHMQKKDGSTGHTFQVQTYDLCLNCHNFRPDLLVQVVTTGVSNSIHEVKLNLDAWAATKAPAALRDKYGNRAWEYTNPGGLSSGGPGPSSEEQALIPDKIKKARYDLYLVLHDGSFGVHNGLFWTQPLLDAALKWVQEELNQ